MNLNNIRVILLLTFYFLGFSIFAKAQCYNDYISGKWKVIGFSNGEIYYNKKTDSTWLSDEIKDSYSGERLTSFIKLSKEIYLSYKFIFSENGYFEQTLDSLPSLTLRAKYCLNKSKNILSLTSTNSTRKNVLEKARVAFKQNFLYLNFQFDKETGTNFILEKM